MRSHGFERWGGWIPGFRAITTLIRDAATAKPRYRIAAQVNDRGQNRFVHGKIIDFEDAPTGPAFILKSAKNVQPLRIVLRRPNRHEVSVVGIKFFDP